MIPPALIAAWYATGQRHPYGTAAGITAVIILAAVTAALKDHLYVALALAAAASFAGLAAFHIAA